MMLRGVKYVKSTEREEINIYIKCARLIQHEATGLCLFWTQNISIIIVIVMQY